MDHSYTTLQTEDYDDNDGDDGNQSDDGNNNTAPPFNIISTTSNQTPFTTKNDDYCHNNMLVKDTLPTSTRFDDIDYVQPFQDLDSKLIATINMSTKDSRLNDKNSRLNNNHHGFRFQHTKQERTHITFISKYEEFKCPICSKQNCNFFCSDCIRSGHFTHSKNPNFLELFADKKLKYIKLKAQEIELIRVVKKQIGNEILKDDLISKIKRLEKNIKTLKEISTEKNSIINELKKLNEERKSEKAKCHKKQGLLKKRIQEVNNELKQRIMNVENQLRNKNFDLKMKHLMQNQLNLLTTCIYPISESFSNSFGNDDDPTGLDNSVDSSEEDDRLLPDVTNEQDKNLTQKTIKYKIVESWIDLDEIYHVQKILDTSVLDHSERNQMNENTFRDSSRRIISALSYLCHLTNLLAWICDIHLPKKLLFSDLTMKQLDRQEFLRKMAEINANIIFLCCIFNQNIDIHSLNPKESFKNMKHLIDVMNVPTNLEKQIVIPVGINKMIQEVLSYDFNETENEDISDEINNDEHDFDIVNVENNDIPDLNLNNDQPTSGSGFLGSLVSSIYFRLHQ